MCLIPDRVWMCDKTCRCRKPEFSIHEFWYGFGMPLFHVVVTDGQLNSFIINEEGDTA